LWSLRRPAAVYSRDCRKERDAPDYVRSS
jgi:hypothetical protein